MSIKMYLKKMFVFILFRLKTKNLFKPYTSVTGINGLVGWLLRCLDWFEVTYNLIPSLVLCYANQSTLCHLVS